MGKKSTKLYQINEILFAAIFILARGFATPLFLVYMWEGSNILYSIKLGICFILYVQLFWCYRITYVILEGIRAPYVSKDKKAPSLVEFGFNIMSAVQDNRMVKMGVALGNFVWIFVLPHLYYGYYLGHLKFNLRFY
jgi:hypothetical protein